MTHITDQCQVCTHRKHHGRCGVAIPRKHTIRRWSLQPAVRGKDGRCMCVHRAAAEPEKGGSHGG